jgi:transposase
MVTTSTNSGTPKTAARCRTVTGLYRGRNTVERLINRLKDWRGIATRFDKTPESYLAGLELRASMIWLGDLLEAAD